jgi:hypothetical protein
MQERISRLSIFFTPLSNTLYAMRRTQNKNLVQ